MTDEMAVAGFKKVEELGRKLGYTSCLKDIVVYVEEKEKEGSSIDRDFFKTMMEEFIIKSI